MWFKKTIIYDHIILAHLNKCGFIIHTNLFEINYSGIAISKVVST